MRALKCEIESYHFTIELKHPEYGPPNERTAKKTSNSVLKLDHDGGGHFAHI